MIRTRYLRRHYIEREVRAFAGTLSRKDRVLELGSGVDWQYIPASITVNIDRAARPGLVADAENLSFRDNSFDAILCLEMLEHVMHPERAVREIHRVLAPGGRALISVPFVFEIHDTRDYFRFTRAGLELLFSPFGSVRITGNGALFSVLCHFLRLTPPGRFLYSLLNNLGYLLDRLFAGGNNPRITLGYTLVVIK